MPDPNKKHNDSIRKVAKKKFPIFHNKDKSESADRAASINFSRLRAKKNYLNKNHGCRDAVSNAINWFFNNVILIY